MEIGTFVGFSVAAWANAVGEKGIVTGLEKSPEFSQLARDKLERFGWNNAEIITGDALQTYVRKATAPSQLGWNH